MFLLQARTPPPYEVILPDGNAKPMNDAELVQFVKDLPPLKRWDTGE
jgi:hypothetical protein